MDSTKQIEHIKRFSVKGVKTEPYYDEEGIWIPVLITYNEGNYIYGYQLIPAEIINGFLKDYGKKDS